MRFSDIKNIIGSCEVLRECEFSTLGLVGKEYGDVNYMISFLNDENYITSFLSSEMCGVICTNDIAEKLKNIYAGGICTTTNPKTLFFKFHNYLEQNTSYFGEMEDSIVESSANIHKSAIVAEKNVLIGKNVKISANVIIHEGVEIGDSVIIREGCILGSPAFYYFEDNADKILVESVGKVKVAENVELHPNVVIEKGVLGGSTVIGKNVKIGSNSVIEHNCYINEKTTVCSGAKFAGGVVIGKNSFIGIGAMFAPNIKIGNGVKISMGSVVTKNVSDNTQVSGNFAIEHKCFIKSLKAELCDEKQENK